MDILPTLWFVAIAALWIGYLLLEGFDLGVGMHMLVRARDENASAASCSTPSARSGTATRCGSSPPARRHLRGVPATGTPRCSPRCTSPSCSCCSASSSAPSASSTAARATTARWRPGWDLGLGLGSLVSAFGVGAALALTTTGLPLDAQRRPGRWSRSRGSRRTPCVGGLAVVGFCLVHAAAFLGLKTVGTVRVLGRAVPRAWSAPIALLPLVAWVLAVQVRDGSLVTWASPRGRGRRGRAGLARATGRGREGWAFIGAGGVPGGRGGVHLRRGLPGGAAVDHRSRLRPDRRRTRRAATYTLR